MKATPTRTAATLACASFVTALALAGCGGGGSDSTATTAATTQQTATSAQKPKSNDGKSKGNGSQGNNSSSSSTASSSNQSAKAPAPGVPLAKGGDNSLQTYGLEAPGSERSQATSAAQAYLGARAAKHWGAACSYLAHQIQTQLEALLKQAKGTKAKGCAAGMKTMSAGVPLSALRKAAAIHVLSLRVKGAHAFLIYRDGQGTPLGAANGPGGRNVEGRRARGQPAAALMPQLLKQAHKAAVVLRGEDKAAPGVA